MLRVARIGIGRPLARRRPPEPLANEAHREGLRCAEQQPNAHGARRCGCRISDRNALDSAYIVSCSA
eukprot:4236849-Pleurochrysis_carterae.AAC.2